MGKHAGLSITLTLMMFVMACTEGEECTVNEVEYALDEQTPLGSSIQDIYNSVRGPYEATFLYEESGDSIGLDTEINSIDGPVTFVDLEPLTGVDPSRCQDYAIAEASVKFSTIDSIFDELLDSIVTTDPDDEGDALHFAMEYPNEIDHGNIHGSYVTDPVVLEQCESVTYAWEIDFSEQAGSSGRMVRHCRSSADGDGEEEEIVSDSSDTIGTWQ